MACIYADCRRAVGVALVAAFPATSPAQHALEEVVVTATPGDRSTQELAQSVTVLGGEALDRARATNLGETLERQLGVSATYFGAGASRPVIRGLAGARVQTLEDGIESMDVSTVSADHAVGIDPLVARQIEIFRGPTTLLYGSGAVGGVINTVTNRLPEVLPEDGLDVALELRGDTVSNERTGALALDGGRGAFAWHADAARRSTGDYEIPGYAATDGGSSGHEADHRGTVENSDLDLDSRAIGGAWLGERVMLGVAVSRLDTTYGIPEHAHAYDDSQPSSPPEGAHEGAPVRIDLGQTRVDLKGVWRPPAGPIEAVELRAGSNDYAHVELEGDEIGTRFGNDAYEARVEILHVPLGGWRGAFGLQTGERRFSALGDEAFVPPVDTRTAGLFVLEQRETDLWQVSLGARVETRRHEPSRGVDVADDAVSFSAAAIRSFGNGYSLLVNAAAAERLPAAEELYAAGPHLASGIVEIGDPTLGSETARHVDVGVRAEHGERTWTLTAFATRYDDFIFLRDTGGFDGATELPIFAFSQQDATFAGFEAEYFAPVARVGRGELDLRIFSDYVRGRLDDGQDVPRIPPLRFGARVAFHTDRLSAGLEATRYADQRDVAAYESPTRGYSLVGADLDVGLPAGNGVELRLFVRAANLLDQDARRHASLVKDIAPLPGRNFALGVRATF